jgi:hypothetical protein
MEQTPRYEPTVAQLVKKFLSHYETKISIKKNLLGLVRQRTIST